MFAEYGIVPVGRLFAAVQIGIEGGSIIGEDAPVGVVQGLLIDQGHVLKRIDWFGKTGRHLPAVGPRVGKLESPCLASLRRDQDDPIGSLYSIHRGAAILENRNALDIVGVETGEDIAGAHVVVPIIS